ncbi:MAG TPA: PilZ domain-containing protein [Candidatus Koribacter sp.]|jgi:hypothetical protein
MPGVTLEVLFVPRKAETLAVVRRAAETLDLNLNICSDAEEVERLLFCHRYDGVILDHDERTESILRALRQSPSSRGAIAIDVHDENVNLQTVFALGANFEIVCPLTVDRARRTLQLAIGLMLLGRRRYYRHPVDIPAQIMVNGVASNGWISNVSEQGIGLRSDTIQFCAGPVECTFTLPDNSSRVALDATVVWGDKAGQAGCRIDNIAIGREQYIDWLSRLFHQKTSGAGQFTEPASRSSASSLAF